MNKGTQVRLVALWGGADDGSSLVVSVRSTGRNYLADFIRPLLPDYLRVEAVSDRPVEPNLRLYALSIDQAPPTGETYALDARTAHDQPNKPAGTLHVAPLRVEILPMNPAGGNLPVWAGGNRDATRDAIIAECRRQGVTLDTHIAYVLATVEHETGGSFRPTREGQFGAHLAQQSENFRRTHLRYEQDGRKKSSFVYFGRGYVQLTHNSNYTNIGSLISLNLAADPDLAIRPNVALFTLVSGMRRGLFTGASLSGRINTTDPRTVHQQFVRARSIINADEAENGEAIADKADHWLAFLQPPAPKHRVHQPAHPHLQPGVRPGNVPTRLP